MNRRVPLTRRTGLQRKTENMSEQPVFVNCNVCGCPLRADDEFDMGMCEHCAYDWQGEMEGDICPDQHRSPYEPR